MNNSKLSRDINNIINNYLDYSISKLNKIFNISNQIKVNLKLKKKYNYRRYYIYMC